jgi:c-di-GMP-binding flagellar brake protein YcgR
MSSQERRRYRRYEVAEMAGRLGGIHPFEALKVSLGGLLVKVRRDREPPLDELTEVELDLDGAPLRGQARVVFVGPDLEDRPDHDLFRVGLAFVSISEQAKRRLQEFITRELGPP